MRSHPVTGVFSMTLRSIHHRDAGAWFAVVSAIAVRDIDRRFRRSKLSGWLFALEPVLLLAVISTLQYYVRNGVPVYGHSNVLFLATGFFPFYLFVHTSRGLSRNLAFDAEFPIINDLDLQIALVLIEIARSVAIGCLVFFTLYVFDVEAASPASVQHLLLSGLIVSTLALGVGLFNSGLISVFPTWAFLYPSASRLIMFGSGVYNVVDYAPPQLQQITSWNPLAHALTLFRLGFFPEYPQTNLDVLYLIKCTVIAVALGFISFSARRRRH